MAVLTAQTIEKSYGDRRVLRGCDLSVFEGDRIGLVGPNGCGKSTFLRILAGRVEADHGEVRCEVRRGLLEQEPDVPGRTVAEALDEATSWHRDLLLRYQAALAAGDERAAAALQDRLDLEGWEVGHRADALCSWIGAPPRGAFVAQLSGGERRRVALARALLGAPDLLFLDEPTNHLDADTIDRLQSFLAGYRGSIVLVTHDRYLLEAVATRIVEIEEGRAVVYDDCSYGDYLVERAERREAALRADASRQALIEREAAWAARSPAARTTKQRARLKRLEALRAIAPARTEDTFTLDLKSGLRLGSTVIEMHGARKRFGDTRILDGFDTTVIPGDRLGLVGPNGVGKTTFLKLILGQETLDGGVLVRGSRVRIGLLDQARSGLVPGRTVFETLGGDNDHVKVGDGYVHVASFLARFLFGREMHDQKVEGLSGGERARLLLARLLIEGANLLLLDEPTNDLDLLTLRVLEEALLAFDGCSLVVTHDRAFIDRACNGVIGFLGDGEVVRYADRLQYAADIERRAGASRAPGGAPDSGRDAPAREGAERRASETPKIVSKRLSWKEKEELAALPARIEALEAEQALVDARLADPATYRDGSPDAAALVRRSREIPGEIEALYARWEALEGR